ncbi:MAG: histidine--tRNA ligase, partial [Alphaproteobacteria bacterium]|nr:histidine--tRNA ligase [Alphaproteobacteria bacterium]
EFTGVFSRTLGEATDVVTKEMYTFADRNGDSLTLRPEGTAGIARAVISNGMAQDAPLKFYYQGPMFRHERPQKGRYRQLHQVGVELLGVAGPLGDVEVITLGAHILERLGLNGKIRLEVNSLGDPESRAVYRDALVAYLSGRLGDLSEESKSRVERNPLRILDSKDEGDKAIVAEGPLYSDFLNETSASFFGEVRARLDDLGVAYRVNPMLVRGFDYYCHTAFEFITDDLGAQGTVMAGGRYDGLVEALGGPSLPGVGWAAGIERLALLMGPQAGSARPIALIPIGDVAGKMALKIADGLRREGFRVDLGYSGNVGKRMKRAGKLNACAAVLMGDDEIATGTVTVRDMDTGEQSAAELNRLAACLERYKA